MQTVRHILSTILILSILATGLPTFTPEDANQDNTVDIRDAILSVRGFADTADSPVAFTTNFGKAVSALQMVAGLTTVIKRADYATSATAPSCLDLPYLISLFDFSVIPVVCFKTAGQTFYYQSIFSSPSSPPPQDSQVC